MALEFKTREQIVSDEIAVIQAALPGQFQFPAGSIVLAIVDAGSGTAQWEESLIKKVNALTRLATSKGTDVDTFLADYGLFREGAVAAVDPAVFSSNVPTLERTIAINSIVSTTDGTQSFKVYPDVANAAYNATLQAWVIPAGQASLAVMVQALNAGVQGNVAANTITIINSPITGIDFVNNPAPFTTGVEQMSDDQAKQYFIDWWNSREKATKSAIEFAIQSVGSNIQFSLVENIAYGTGLEFDGYFYAVIDDGTGNPSDELINSVKNAIDAVRGFTIRFDVKKPLIDNADITANVLLPANFTDPTLQAAIVAALTEYINLIPFGGTLYYTRIGQIIYNVISANAGSVVYETNVSGITLNGGTADLTSTPKEKIKARTLTINVTTAS